MRHLNGAKFGTAPDQFRAKTATVGVCSTLGTLSKDDDDGSENDGKKINLRSFKLNRVCLDSLNMSNAGDFSWS